jgi:hypothetical protein
MFAKKDARKAYEEYGEADNPRMIAHIEWFKYPNQETADKARAVARVAAAEQET